MSTEEGSVAPPTTGSEKSQLPKAPATFSSFINKNASGKKFAPKAVRRRPGTAVPPIPAAPKLSPAVAAGSTLTSAAIENESELPTTVAPEKQPQSQLPTPAATQQEPVQGRGKQSITEPSTPIPAPARVDTIPQEVRRDRSPSETVGHSTAPRPAEEELESGRSPKRQRLNATADNRESQIDSNLAPTDTSQTYATAPSIVSIEAADTVPEDTISHTETEQTATETPVEAPVETGQDSPTDQASTPAPRPAARKPRPGRRRLPWVAVNQSQDENNGEATPGAESRPPEKTRGRRKVTNTADAGEVGDEENPSEGQGNEGGDTVQAAPKRPGRKTGARRKVNETVVDGVAEGPDASKQPSRKTRKPRSDKGTRRKQATGETGEGNAAEGDRPRKRQKRSAPGASNRNAEGNAGGDAEPKRKGRPPREPTPEGAEHQTIEPTTTFMDDIASHNIRVGHLSEREKKMRQINWTEVKERRRQEEQLAADGGQAARDALNARLDEAGAAREEETQSSSGPRFEVIDGQITLIQDSGTIDREADADREIQNMVEVNEENLTNHITTRSFMRNRKRRPNEFILPGQGKRWTIDDTDKFYDGLRMFGTDFEMIASWFPGHTRRSIKLKFVREERLNPDGIKEVLLGQRNSNWDDHLRESNIPAETFEAADTIKQQLEDERLEMEREIEEARKQAEEEKRQRRLAGILSEDENGEKETGKGKKKKGRKEKAVTFAPGESVEILEENSEWLQNA